MSLKKSVFIHLTINWSSDWIMMLWRICKVMELFWLQRPWEPCEDTQCRKLHEGFKFKIWLLPPRRNNNRAVVGAFSRIVIQKIHPNLHKKSSMTTQSSFWHWAFQSPDLNPCKNLWGELKLSEDLGKFCIEEFLRFLALYLFNLFKHYGRRLSANTWQKGILHKVTQEWQ